MSCRRQLITAACVADAAGVYHAPGVLLLEGRTILACSTPSQIGNIDDAERIDLPDHVLLPALVNAHAHLDLSHLDHEPYEGDFVGWIDKVRSQRAIDSNAIEASMKLGIEQSLRGGTALIGDIAGGGSSIPLELLRDSPLGGVSFHEVFGIGAARARGLEAIKALRDALVQDDRGVQLGLQPHAPYSCAPEVFRAALASGLPLCTHLAETRAEIEFVEHAKGPFAAMLQAFGIWDDSIEAQKTHPIDFVHDQLQAAPLVAAHLNYVEDRHLEIMAHWPITIAYCPRASDYFNHPAPDHPPHRYQAMLKSGINVALGTDGRLCLDTHDRISVLDEMRFLFRRDALDPRNLLAMGTINGARSLGVDESLFTFEPGEIAGLLALKIDPSDPKDPLVQVMQLENAPHWILEPVLGTSHSTSDA
ncbi:MAG: amidohydrolase family protein [Planctomycetota bacterium]|nr:amidohydrolase family protein [Planctomycetota bacterium]